jgi:lysophospholipase L1-like esterase
MASPNCTINGLSAVGGVDVPASSSVAIALASGPTSPLWSLRCVSTDDSTTADSINASLSVNQATKTATFTTPALQGLAALFESKVNNGIDPITQLPDATLTTTFKVSVLSALGSRVIAKDERDEGDPNYGWITVINSLIRGGILAPKSPDSVGSLALWLRSDSGVSTSGSNVTSWSDRSGSGIIPAFVQASSSAQLTYSASGGIGGLPKLSCPDGTRLMEPAVATNLVSAGAARTIFVVAACTNPAGGTLLTFRRSGACAAFAYQSSITSSSISPLYWYNYSDGVAINGQLNPPPSISSPFCSTWTFQAENNIYGQRHNGVKQYVSSQQNSNTALSTSDAGSTGVTLCNRIDAIGLHLGWTGDIYEVIVFSRLLSTTEIRGIEAYISLRYGISMSPPSSRKQVMFDGDSITRGVGASLYSTNYVERVASLLGTSWDRGNFGHDGTQIDQILLRRPRQVDPCYDGARPKNIYVCMAGTNNLAFGQSAASIYSTISSNIANAKLAGWKVIQQTVTGRIVGMNGWTSGMETVRQSLNTLISGNAAGADRTVDHTTTPRLESPNTTDFPDGLHPADSGHSLISANVYPVILTL